MLFRNPSQTSKELLTLNSDSKLRADSADYNVGYINNKFIKINDYIQIKRLHSVSMTSFLSKILRVDDIHFLLNLDDHVL